MALENALLGPKFMSGSGFIEKTEVPNAIDGKGEECAIAHSSKRHSKDPVHLLSDQIRLHVVETHHKEVSESRRRK